ncbi:MAG TPA: TonB-dependent receptor [Candidatus Sulfotelmatobacter sp.]|nr:TonB-dependent receptor [Candidatus Sulfotelmatobacter sp.]
MPKKVSKFLAQKQAWIRASALLLAAGCLATAGWAQQPTPADLGKMSLEELMNVEVDTVYGASKFEQKVGKAPSYVTIITAEEIAKYGYRTLADLLRSVPGFYVSYDRNYTYAGVMGIQRPGDNNNRILMLIDGHRLNDNLFEAFDAGTTFSLDLDLVERVEIIRGPGSALYGADAFLAVINVITKRGRDVKAAEVSGSPASLRTLDTRVTYGDKAEHGPEMLFSGTFYHSLGNQRLFYPEFDSPATNNGYAVDADGDAWRSLFGSVQYKGFSFEGVYSWRDKTIPTASYGTVFNDPRTQTTDIEKYLDLKYNHKFASGWEFLGRFGFDEHIYDGTYVMDYAGNGIPPYTLNQDATEGQFLTLELAVSKTFFEKHRVTVGTETRWNIKQDQENYDLAPYALYLDDHRSSTAPSLYAEDEYTIRRNLVVNAGIRFDDYLGVANSTNPRLALIYNPWEKTALKFVYGQAFRVPSQYERYYSIGTIEEGNPALQPETIKTSEAILEQRVTKHSQVVVAGYYNSMARLITEQTEPDGAVEYVNLYNVHGKGLDLEWAGKWASGWEARLAYSVQDTIDESTGMTLNNSPEHLPKFNMSAPIIPRRLFFSFDGQYVNQRETLEGTRLGGYFLGDATVFAPELYKGLTLSASAYNVFDKRYADPGGIQHREVSIPQDGRTLALKLTYRFKKQE